MSASASAQRTRDLVYCAVSAAIIAVCAWITIPATVPFTMQIFGIFMVLGLLGGRRGTTAILVYLLLGAIGLPVFAGFSGGLGALLGTTGGYLLSYLLVGLLYWFLTARLGTSTPVVAVTMVLGLALCYAFGTAWFMIVYARTSGAVGLVTALGWCVFPFIIPDLVKIAMAIALSRVLRRHVR
ncbi:biotin transporter BioY [Dysosmobacter sp.]|uniref:biotin transporter BioY n=1 Tax=Dysosmobacter sp. TaxID=2591382 RepID=UPI002A8F5390|nr:biotin transporter BioY [Dysosmobacter sp.]MDY3281409.1 biotin transporter BioY [Dysosmobacter sp.]